MSAQSTPVSVPNPPQETWRPVPGCAYDVSDAGSVRRARPGRGRTFPGRLLKPQPNQTGHLTVSVWQHGKRCRHLVHVLVAGAFIGPCPPGLEVNHKDGNPGNNAIANLEYVTHAENIRHGYRDKRGEKHPLAKLSNADAAEIRRLRAAGAKGADLARRFRVSQQTICGVWKGRNYA